MLVVKGDRLIGWRTTGFGDLDAQPRSIESSAGDAGALARAVATGRPVVDRQRPGLERAGVLPRRRRPRRHRRAAAGRRPCRGGGLRRQRGATAPTPSPSHAAVEVFVRHAGRCLEALTVQRAAQARTSFASG